MCVKNQEAYHTLRILGVCVCVCAFVCGCVLLKYLMISDYENTILLLIKFYRYLVEMVTIVNIQ